jgi:EmrB/QacA subfamily drug resistance transporter
VDNGCPAHLPRSSRSANRSPPWYEPAPIPFVARLRSYSWFVVGTVCIGAFMGQVDASIAQLVLPELEHDFQAPVGLVSWVALAYLLALSAMLPIYGRLADMFGRKMMYTVGFIIFIAGSAICGFAPTLGFLIIARVAQAVGAGLLQANSVAIIVAAAGQNRGRAIGAQAAAQAVGLSVGPALGGVLIYSLGWRWVFWLNVPFGLIGALIGWLVLPQTQNLPGGQRFDWWGAILFIPALTALLLVVNRGGGNWNVASPASILAVTLATVLLAAFVLRERLAQSPLIDLKLFRRATFSAGSVAGLLSYAILFGMFFVLPFVFERGYGESALLAGLRLTVIPVALGLVAPASGALSDRVGARLLTVSGMVVTFAALGGLFLALDQRFGNLTFVMVALGLFGVGQGLFTAPNNSAIMAAAPPEERGEAGGILNVMRSLGTSVGIAAASAVFTWRLDALSGHPGDTLHAPRNALLSAAHGVIGLFCGFVILAAGISLLQSRNSQRRATGVPPA